MGSCISRSSSLEVRESLPASEGARANTPPQSTKQELWRAIYEDGDFEKVKSLIKQCPSLLELDQYWFDDDGDDGYTDAAYEVMIALPDGFWQDVPTPLVDEVRDAATADYNKDQAPKKELYNAIWKYGDMEKVKRLIEQHPDLLR